MLWGVVIQCRKLAESLGINENSPGLDEGPERIARWTGLGVT